MARAFKCDRCGEYFEPYSKVPKYFIMDSDACKRVDLCELCIIKFESWWSAGKTIENKEEN